MPLLNGQPCADALEAVPFDLLNPSTADFFGVGGWDAGKCLLKGFQLMSLGNYMQLLYSGLSNLMLGPFFAHRWGEKSLKVKNTHTVFAREKPIIFCRCPKPPLGAMLFLIKHGKQK